MGRRPKNYVPPTPIVTIRCVRCGQNKAETEFFANKWSEIYSAQKQVPLCKDCVQAIFDKHMFKYGEDVALFLLCAELDVPYDKLLLERITDKTPPLTIGKYIQRLQMKQYDSKSFAETVTNGGQRCPKVQKSADRLTALQEDVTALREDVQAIKEKLVAE